MGGVLSVPVLLGQGYDNLHIVDWEEARVSVYHAFVPVVIYLVGEDDDVTLLKAQLAIVLWLKVIQGPGTRLVQHLRLVAVERGTLWPGQRNDGEGISFPISINCVVDLDV